MSKYITKIITADGSKLEWNADSEESKNNMLETIMLEKGYIESTTDYGFLYVNREHIVAIEVHNV